MESDIVYIKASTLPPKSKRAIRRVNRRYLQIKLYLDPTYSPTQKTLKGAGIVRRNILGQIIY